MTVPKPFFWAATVVLAKRGGIAAFQVLPTYLLRSSETRGQRRKTNRLENMWQQRKTFFQTFPSIRIKEDS